MELGYEIPQGSKIHFGLSAKIKRDIEQKAVEIFYQNGFEEILTPSFALQENSENSENAAQTSRKTIRLSAEGNKQIVLRHDNTTDVIKIINRHLGGKSGGKNANKTAKWFYIQPCFSYPSIETHQIGAECLNAERLGEVLCVATAIFAALNLTPILQISNMNIPRICAIESGLEIEIFSKMKLDRVLDSAAHSHGYLKDLLFIQTKQDLERYIPDSPRFLRDELEVLLESASFCHYERTIFSPLFFSQNPYYDSLFFRAFEGNRVFLLGGKYEIDALHSCGFAIYTNDVIEHILNKAD